MNASITPSDPAAQPPEEPGELEALYRSWRILDLVRETSEALPPAWLQILDIARSLLDGRPIAGVDLPDDLSALISRGDTKYTKLLRTEVRQRVVEPLRTDTVILPLRHIQDFPRITPPDLMLRKLWPTLFNFRLLSGDVGGLYGVDREPVIEKYEQIIEEEVPVYEPGRKKRQKVYALLDISNSMRDHNKVIFAKGLMLAYLIKAAEERAAIYFRTFGNTVHSRTDCRTPDDFAALARRILAVSPDGSTDIKGAVANAIADIRQIDDLNRLDRVFEAPTTELLLVSDCESYSIPHVPHGVKLHTVHLLGGRMMTAYREGFERIKAESVTFNEIATGALRLPDTTRDRWLLLQEEGRLEADAHVLSPQAMAGDRAARRARLNAISDVYERLDEAGRRGGAMSRRMRGFSLGRMPGLHDFVEAFVRAIRVLRPHRSQAAPARRHARPALQFRQRQ